MHVDCCGRRRKHDRNSNFKVGFQCTYFTQWTENINAGSINVLHIGFHWCKTLGPIVKQWFIESKRLSIYKIYFYEIKWIENVSFEIGYNPMFWTTFTIKFVYSRDLASIFYRVHVFVCIWLLQVYIHICRGIIQCLTINETLLTLHVENKETNCMGK